MTSSTIDLDALESIISKKETIDKFLPEVALLKQKLKRKRTAARQVIGEKMKELHQLVDKWEQRFLDTASETITEKVEKLGKQERHLKILSGKMSQFITQYNVRPFPLHHLLVDEEDESVSVSCSYEDADDEASNARKMMEEVTKLTFPLKPNGVTSSELEVDVQAEFGELLEEAQKSLKRNLTFIGGIIRGYLRRGQKNDKWIKMIRRLEARFEEEKEKIIDDPLGQSLEIPVPVEPIRTVKTVVSPHRTSTDKVWACMADLYKYLDNRSMRVELLHQLDDHYQALPSQVEFFLPQLTNISIHNKDFPELEEFILVKCKQSANFAIQAYFLLHSMGDSGSKQWTRKCRKFIKKIEHALPRESHSAADSPAIQEHTTTTKEERPNNTPSEELFEPGGITQKTIRREGKGYFFGQVKFMNELVQISHRLALKFNQPELFQSELQRELGGLLPFIKEGTAVVPFTSSEHHRILRILNDECFPIPTYGRVLYFFASEVWPLPVHYTREMANEYLKVKMEGDGNSCSESQAESASEEQSMSVSRTGAFGEMWPLKVQRLKKQSPLGSLQGWDCRLFIVKHGDLVLQEQFVMQLVHQFQNIFAEEGLPLHLTTYNIMALTSDSGLIEVVPNSKSIDKLKQSTPDCPSLKAFFKAEWPEKEAYEKARTNFVNSLAAYCVLCYFLQIKDRHNGNIMLDSSGFLLHIDFGYLLARTVEFEKAPFKLTEEMIDLLGGDKSKHFRQFIDLVVQGFLAIRRHYEKIMLLIEMTITRPSMEFQFIACLAKDTVLKSLRRRFRLEFNDAQIRELVLNLVTEAKDNWRTTIYDTYQRILNDIH